MLAYRILCVTEAKIIFCQGSATLLLVIVCSYTTSESFHLRSARQLRVQLLPDAPTRSSVHAECVSPAASTGIVICRMEIDTSPISAITCNGTRKS